MELEAEIRRLKDKLEVTVGNLVTSDLMWEITEEEAISLQQKLEKIEKWYDKQHDWQGVISWQILKEILEGK